MSRTGLALALKEVVWIIVELWRDSEGSRGAGIEVGRILVLP